MIRRINLFAGAGAGKSTLAAWLFAHLKLAHYKRIELIQEFIKKMAIKGYTPSGWDQWHIWNKQQRREEDVLRDFKIYHTITDSPTFLAASYAKYFNSPYGHLLIEAANIYDNEYPSLNIFLERNPATYDKDGRYQDLEAAKELDAFILGQLISSGREFKTFRVNQRQRILKYVMSKLPNPKTVHLLVRLIDKKKKSFRKLTKKAPCRTNKSTSKRRSV